MQSVKAAYLSFMALAPGDHGLRSEWHQMDHMPEQYSIPGIVWGQRYVATPACIAARLHQVGNLCEAQYLINYLMADPLGPTLQLFGELAEELRAQGRMFDSIGKLRGAFTITGMQAAPRAMIRPSVLPFRPHRGVYVVIEGESASLDPSSLTRIDGVAGFWTMAVDAANHTAYSTPGRHHATLVYLDGPVLETTRRVNDFVAGQVATMGAVPLLAGPFVTTSFFDWDQFGDDPEAV